MKLIMTVGVSASGKTTWAKEQKHCVNINRDDIRFNIVHQVLIGQLTNLIRKMKKESLNLNSMLQQK